MFKKMFLDVIAAILVVFLLSIQTDVQAKDAGSMSNPETAAPSNGCHFGLTTLDLTGYDLSILGVGNYLDWGTQRNSSVPNNIDYYPVISVGGDDAAFAAILPGLPSRLSASPGSVWIIGNEPDSQVTYQDHIAAETYAERFYQVATLIRANDPSAKIAFGTIIQPTPVRLFYLTKVIDRLTLRAGDRAKALSLIDIYSIHSFILNEQPLFDKNGKNISWGAGVPVGYDPATWPPYRVIDGSKTYDINIFKSGVIAFRQWMKGLGEQSKPLWITEYGSLFPTFLNVSEQQTATYMEQTFDFMLSTRDASLGDVNDGNRLVQKWLWYSLNDKIDHFGGSLYNPANHQLTTVGDRFMKYNPSTAIVPVTNPDAYIDTTTTPSIAAGGIGNYRITLRVGNNISSDRMTSVRVDFYLAGNFLGSQTVNIPRCAGKQLVSFNVNHLLLPGGSYSFMANVDITDGNGVDLDPTNDVYTFPPITVPEFRYVYLSRISR